MSQSKCKATRRAALAGTLPQSLPVNTYSDEHHAASRAFGLKLFRATVPSNPVQAHAPEPLGKSSVEYAKQDAIEPRNNPYDPEYNPSGRRPFADVLKEVQAAFPFAPLC